MTSVILLLAVLGGLGVSTRSTSMSGEGGCRLRVVALRPSCVSTPAGTPSTPPSSRPCHGWPGTAGGAVVLAGLFTTEIVITMCGFVLEDRGRRPLGGVYAGERVTRSLMAIVYGAIIARLVPVLLDWWDQPSGLRAFAPDVPAALRGGLTAMGIGIALSGLRGPYAAAGGRYGAWPWTAART